MKKTLAVILAMLVAFSMLSMAASAAEAQEDINNSNVVVIFKVNGEIVKSVGYSSLANAVADDFPGEDVAPQEYKATKIVDGVSKEYSFTLQGWESDKDTSKLYYPGTLQKHPEASVITLTAKYSEKDLSGRQSFWQLIESIFARINILFEYFATIFNF